tara:strand:+ start:25302 stop:26105 length:804 start_codon:yes stop_codon:yes gene_type:complete
MIRLLFTVFFSCITTLVSAAEMKLAVTTSFENSGLADVLLPAIKSDIGLDVQLLVVGTGQALRLGAAGDVDAVLVHSRPAEEAFIADGFGIYRREIMYNDFVLVGPLSDPAGIAQATTADDALLRIAQAQATFVSRGDDSGTHKTEVALWRTAGLDPASFGAWYRAVGAGMGTALNTAAGLNGYILADRASWLNFGNKGALELLFSGDPALFNQYAYLPVNTARHPSVRGDLVLMLEDWLTSDRAATLINQYSINGEQLFVFNATQN